ncbi:MAG: T9SS type A sorting domain-containing protein [Bacteroidia bacterium]
MKNKKHIILSLLTSIVLLFPPLWGGLGRGELLAQVSTTGYIVKGGPDTGSFTGGVFMALGSKINYGINEQRVLVDAKPGIIEQAWNDVIGVNQSPTSLTKTSVDGWGNAGAVSNNTLDTLENGWLQYTVNSTSDILGFGLSTNNTDAHYNSINYAVMINAGQLSIYNNGQLIGNYGAVTLNDSIRISRIGNILLFTKNNQELHNQALDAKQPLMADVAIYTQGTIVQLKSSFAENISKCDLAISFINTNSSIYNNTSENEIWFKFIADSTTIIIRQISDSLSLSYIQRMELYSGNCTNLQLIDTTESISNSANILTLIATDLTIGNDYFIKVLKSGLTNAIFNLELNSIFQQTACNSPCVTQAISQSCDLVCNGNFEYYTSLPSGLGNNTGYDPIGGICSWQNGSLHGTSDYYNQNTTAVDVDVPTNYSGIQTSLSSGNAKGYVGILSWSSSSVWGDNYHEYISQKLISPLLAGHTYRATMWVSLADKSDAATDNLGMYFTNSSTYLTSLGGYGIIYPANSQIVTSTSGTYLNDITQWKKITGTIIGSGEEWITIGNFNNNIQYVNNSTSVPGRGAYYYIDEVSVIEEDPNFNVTQGTPMCQGQMQTLTASGAVSYLWMPGGATTSSITVSPTTNTTYTVIGTDSYGCERTLTTTIEVYPTPLLNIASQSICPGESVQLYAYIPNVVASYTWTPGALPNLAFVSPTTTTTYTVTESLHGCTNTQTVTVKPLPAVNASPISATICAGNSIALNASGATYYNWAPGSSGLSNYIIPNPIASPVSTTTYTVTGISALTNCRNTATVTITVEQSPIVNAISNISVSGCSILVPATLFSSTTSGATYTWTNSNTAIGLPANGIGNLPSFTANNTSSSPITATITVIATANGCAGQPTTFTITIIPCCVATGSQAHTFVNGNNAVNFYTIYGPTATGANIALNGTFVVSNNITLSNCEVKLGTDAVILIKSGFTLNITTNSHLSACNNMWDKILIEPGGYLIVDKNSLIEDAKTAVYSMNGGKFLLSSARLNKNYKHIELTPYNGVHPGSIVGSSLTCQLIPGNAPTTLKPPYSGYRTDVGIEINEVDNVQIGTNVGTNLNTLKNMFKNMNTGIRSGQSSVKVYNNNFTSVSNGLPPNTGAAIVAAGDLDVPPNYTARNLIVGDDTPNGLNTFTNCVNGVVAYFNMNASVKWNDFNGINSKGVYVFANQQHNQLVIESNTFTNINTQGGIAIHSMNNRSGSSPPSLTRIQFNEIKKVNKGTGILIEELNNQTTGALYIAYNNKISEVQYGVRASNLNNVDINNNYIEIRQWINHTPPSVGIHVTGCYGTDIKSNGVSIVPQSFALKNGGIYLSLSPNSNVSCNTTSDMGFGIKCAGQMPSDIYNNLITKDFYGLWLDNNGFIGVQDGNSTAGFPSYNKWANIPVSGNSATSKRTFTSNNTIGAASPIVYKNNAGFVLNALYNPNPTGASAASVFTLTPTSNGAAASPTCTIAQFHRSTFSNLLNHAQDIALENISFPGNDANGKWLSKQGLLVNIKTDSIDVSSDGILQTFVNQATTDNMGKQAELNTIINNPAKYNTTDMSAAQVLNASVVPINDIETNQKLLNAIIIGNFLTNVPNYTATQINSIRTIAGKCPFTDGLAVYQARVMLSSIDTLGTEYINSCEMVDDATRMLYTNTTSEDSSAIMVYPNPASNQLTITYQLEATDIGSIEIYNLIGAKVLTQILDASANEKTINITSLNDGVYIYKCAINGIIVKSDKLLIMK